MNIHNVSLHIFHSFKLLIAMGAMMQFSWFLEWVLGWYLVDLCHVSFEMLRRDGNLANATFDRHRYFWIASLAPSVFYKLLEISKFLRALLTAYSFSMSPQLMIPQWSLVGEDLSTPWINFARVWPFADGIFLSWFRIVILKVKLERLQFFLVHIVFMICFVSSFWKQLVAELTRASRQILSHNIIFTVFTAISTCLIFLLTFSLSISTVIITGAIPPVILYFLHCTTDQLLQNVFNLVPNPDRSSATDNYFPLVPFRVKVRVNV